MFSSQQYYYDAQHQSDPSPVVLAHHSNDCLYGDDLYDVLLEAFDANDEEDDELLLLATMAPGCLSKQQTTSELPSTVSTSSGKCGTDDLLFGSSNELINLDQIPLPSTPPPPTKKFIVYDTLDSFEILEQTVRKQRRLAKRKNTDMRMKVLLKRTFDLVCEIMDHENGFDDNSDVYVEKINPVKAAASLSSTKCDEQQDTTTTLEVNVKHNDYADELLLDISGSCTNVVPTSGDESFCSSKRKIQNDDDQESDDEDVEDDEEENRTAPGCERPKSKRQKFTNETTTTSNSNNNWCKQENDDESLFDACCHCDEHDHQHDHEKNKRQNSIYIDDDDDGLLGSNKQQNISDTEQ